MKKRMLAMCMALCLLLGMLPVTAFAATTGWTAEYSTTAITATGTYELTKADADWTMIIFKAPFADDFTFTVQNGTCGLGGTASYYVYAPASPVEAYTKTLKANGQFVLAMQTSDDVITLTVTCTTESSTAYTDWTNLHTPSSSCAGAPATPTILASPEEHSVYKVSDSEYRLDSADGLQLYVEMRYNNKFDIVAMYGTNPVVSLHGNYEGTDYDFLEAMRAYYEAMTEAGVYYYPLTTDIMAFLMAYGDGDGNWYDLSTDPTAWMFCLYTDYIEPEETEPEETEPEETEPEETEPEETEPEATEPETTEPEETEPTVTDKAFDDVYNDSNPITAPGTYEISLLENTTWTMIQFTPEEIGDYTFTVDKGACGYCGAGSWYTMIPTTSGTSITRSITAVGQNILVGITGDDANVQLTISKTYSDYENVCTPDAEAAGMPSTAEAVDITAVNTAVKVSDTEYRLNTAEGPILYVDLSADIIGFDAIMDGEACYGKIDDITYNFTTAMQAYGAAMGDGYTYPLTTDLVTFLQACGETQGWYADSDAATPWMFCVYADTDSGEVSDITVVATVTDQAVASEEAYILTWTATEAGTLTVNATPTYVAGSQYTAFQVIISASASDYASGSYITEYTIQTPDDPWFEAITDYTLEEGQYVVVKLYSMKNYAYCDGSVSATLTFVPYVGETEIVKEEMLWDDVYNDTNPITAAGSYDVSLLENAEWTLIMFTPEEIGIYTISVSSGTCGYAGATSAFYWVPGDAAASFEQEVSSVGNSIVIAIESEDTDITVTVEKTGESEGSQSITYTTWENVHTPDSTMAAKPTNYTAIDITEAHTAYMVSDSEYRLDSADGPILYVNLSNSVIDFKTLTEALTLRGKYEDVNYDFKTAMTAYYDAFSSAGVYWYPLTTDIMAFLIGYGTNSGWYTADYSSISAVIDGTAQTPWMFCAYTDDDTAIEEEEPADTLPSAENVEVTSGVPYVLTWTATGNGTLTVDATPSYVKGEQYTAYIVYIYASEEAYTGGSSYISNSGSQTPGDSWGWKSDFTVEEGQYVVIELYAKNTYVNCDGTVNATLTFTPEGSGEVEQVEWAWDDVYNADAPITEVGTWEVTLVENATWTMFSFVPTEIGIYTITVSSGTCGYSGATTAYCYVPSSSAASFEQEVKSVGNAVFFSICSDDPNVTVTIEKTGESEGIVTIDYIMWENQHTPTEELVGSKGGTKIDITEEHVAIKISDSEYRLDTADGPQLYVNLGHSDIMFKYMFGTSNGANTLRGQYEGVYYDFKTAMSAYYDVMYANSTYWYPLTTDIMAFLIGYGNGAGFWYELDKTEITEVLAAGEDAKTPWMFCLYAVEVEDEPIVTVGIESASVTLESNPTINFTATAGYTMKICIGDAEAVEVTSDSGIYSIAVMAQDMMSTITAELYDADGNLLDTEVFTLADYVAAIIADETQSDETKALANALLCYCQYAAYIQGNYDGECGELEAIADDAFDSYDFSIYGAPTGTSIYGYIESGCALCIRLPEGYTATVDGIEATATAEILAQDYDEAHTFVIFDADGNEVYSRSFTVLGYIGQCLAIEGLSEDTANLLTAMYYYWAAAEAYTNA